MIHFFNQIFDSIAAYKAAIFSICSAFLGTALGVDVNVANEMATQISADPQWFCIVKPILQTLAWSVAIIGGSVAIIKSIKKKKKKI